jgi:hypothetical protein
MSNLTAIWQMQCISAEAATTPTTRQHQIYSSFRIIWTSSSKQSVAGKHRTRNCASPAHQSLPNGTPETAKRATLPYTTKPSYSPRASSQHQAAYITVTWCRTTWGGLLFHRPGYECGMEILGPVRPMPATVQVHRRSSTWVAPEFRGKPA